MSRTILCALVIVSAALLAASSPQTESGAASPELVWVGVTAWVPSQEPNDYLIGTIEKKILDEIEQGTYNRKFLKISNLRIEDTEKNAYGNEEKSFHDCADQYDMGTILIRYEDALSIELKKGDPLKVE